MKHLLFAAIVVVLAAEGCNNGGSSGSTTAPSAPTTTETFSGTVPVGGSDFHNFTVAQAGELDVTLTAAGPPATITMGLGIGTGGSTCVVASNASTTTQAGTTAQLSGPVTPGSLCVQVSDVGNDLGDVTYTVTVAHS